MKYLTPPFFRDFERLNTFGVINLLNGAPENMKKTTKYLFRRKLLDKPKNTGVQAYKFGRKNIIGFGKFSESKFPTCKINKGDSKKESIQCPKIGKPRTTSNTHKFNSSCFLPKVLGY